MMVISFSNLCMMVLLVCALHIKLRNTECRRSRAYCTFRRLCQDLATDSVEIVLNQDFSPYTLYRDLSLLLWLALTLNNVIGPWVKFFVVWIVRKSRNTSSEHPLFCSRMFFQFPKKYLVQTLTLQFQFSVFSFQLTAFLLLLPHAALAQTGELLPPPIRAVITGPREVQVGKTLVLDASVSTADAQTVSYVWKRDGQIVSRTEELVLTLDQPGRSFDAITAPMISICSIMPRISFSG